jgi:hypothetical protein
MEIDPLNPKKALDDLKLFCVIVSSDEKAFQELEKEIEGKYFCFKDRKGRSHQVHENVNDGRRRV